ncbi:hypothetical protein EJ04DRAFT_535811 [Polyplosphaeria fusca]|uniref:DUF6594 domain-containing protein n=1 Tax=Polyplosphaeria fusca TaxID=682080 RepID=A0A9P4QXA8_9PLEO|nr:hypothetical protein EJ04DRAFT_535811 [Polyplosphaeria fusca]
MAPEDSLRSQVTGYPKFAAKMELQPEIAIFSRFGALNAKNLMYYQAEILWLEKQLQLQEAADSNDPVGKRSQYALNWYWLSQSRDDGSMEQLNLVMRIRELLRQYSKFQPSLRRSAFGPCSDSIDEALIQQSTILQYPQPEGWDLHHVQDFLQTKDMGPLALIGPDAGVWGSVSDRKSHRHDLVTLHPRPKADPFSVWVANNAMLQMFRCGLMRLKKPSSVYGAVGYEDTTILAITYWGTSILASLLPIVSIIALYCVHSMAARLGVICFFNVLISVCLSGFTDAKRSEIFAVTAA